MSILILDFHIGRVQYCRREDFGIFLKAWWRAMRIRQKWRVPLIEARLKRFAIEQRKKDERVRTLEAHCDQLSKILEQQSKWMRELNDFVLVNFLLVFFLPLFCSLFPRYVEIFSIVEFSKIIGFLYSTSLSTPRSKCNINFAVTFYLRVLYSMVKSFCLARHH